VVSVSHFLCCSDVKFVIGQTRKVVLAHRSLLSARCEVFRAMFTDKSQSHQDPEIPLVLSDMTIDIFLPMLEYIYTNCVTLTRKNVSTIFLFCRIFVPEFMVNYQIGICYCKTSHLNMQMLRLAKIINLTAPSYVT